MALKSVAWHCSNQLGLLKEYAWTFNLQLEMLFKIVRLRMHSSFCSMTKMSMIIILIMINTGLIVHTVVKANGVDVITLNLEEDQTSDMLTPHVFFLYLLTCGQSRKSATFVVNLDVDQQNIHQTNNVDPLTNSVNQHILLLFSQTKPYFKPFQLNLKEPKSHQTLSQTKANNLSPCYKLKTRTQRQLKNTLSLSLERLIGAKL